jgi:Putative Tad-like Flp pilus-assembly
MKMERNSESFARPVRDGQRGQSLVFAVTLLVGLIAMAALVIDLGEVYFSYQQLKAATNAAALAGGGAIPNTSGLTATAAAYDYSALDLNTQSHLQNATLSVSLACINPATYPTLGLPPCALYPSCPSGCNMIQVTETANVPLFFAKIFGVKSIPISASAVASAKGGLIPPYHIMMVLDATGSMGNGKDAGCTGNGTSVTPEQCAEYGVQTLLEELDPCSVSLATCTPSSQPGTSLNADDQVGMMVFPGMCSNTGTGVTWQNCPVLPAGSELTNTIANTEYAPSDYACPPTTIPYGAYNNNPEYLVLGFQSNYRFSDSSGLNSGSNIFRTVGVGTNNCGVVPDTAHYDTFYAGALQAAQDYLTQNNTVGVQNVIIILSDGDANATQNSCTPSNNQQDLCGNVTQVDGPNAGLVFPPLDDCEQAVQAATYAKNHGTLIYSISYGSELTGCASDQTSYKFNGVKGDGNYPTPCSTMQGMSSTPLTQYFFSVPMNDSSNPTETTICANAVPLTALNQVFTTIASQLTVARLVPSGDF